GPAAYPYWPAMMQQRDCQAMGRIYLERAPAGLTGERRLTDKQLLNIEHVGLIHLILPKAKIIHIQRDPRDVALSIFSIGFNANNNHGYAKDLAQLGRYWRAYDELMS